MPVPPVSPVSMLLTEYMDSTVNSVVGTLNHATPEDLINDFIAWATGVEQFRIPFKPLDWVEEAPAQSIEPWAVFHAKTALDGRERPARHRGEPAAPQPGDVVIFDSRPFDEKGLAGLYLDRGPHEWYVYTQGPHPAQVLAVPVPDFEPVGWWRLRPEKLSRHLIRQVRAARSQREARQLADA